MRRREHKRLVTRKRIADAAYRDSPQVVDQAALWRRRWAVRLATGLAAAEAAAVVRDRATDHRPRGR